MKDGTVLPMLNALYPYRLIRRIFKTKILFPFLSITTFIILFDNNDFLLILFFIDDSNHFSEIFCL